MTSLPLLFALATLPQDSILVSGIVRDEVRGDPVTEVSVTRDDLLMARTDRDGRFRFRTLPLPGEFIVAFRRLGFAPHAETITVAGRDSIDLTINLRPVPTVLEEITVDGRTFTIRNPDLVGFYNRREVGNGRYLTQFEIDRAMSFDLGPYMRRIRPTSAGPCLPFTVMAVYLDGIRVPSFDVLNRVIAPRQVGGIEFYPEEEKSRLPLEFQTPGATCGTLMVWSRNPRGDSASLVGIHGSYSVGGPGSTRSYAGARFRFPLRDRPSSLALLFSADATSRSATNDTWRAFLTPIFRPLGLASAWYTGAGITIVRPPGGAQIAVHPAILSGLEARVGPWRPFVEARVFRVRDPVLTLVTGLALAIGDDGN